MVRLEADYNQPLCSSWFDCLELLTKISAVRLGSAIHFLVHGDKVERAIMATTTYLSEPLELSRQIEWCSLFLAHLSDFATLAWQLVADGMRVECIVMNTLQSLDSVPFDASKPLLTYHQAREMLITEGIALNLEYTGTRFDDRSRAGHLVDLPRLASRVGHRLLFSADLAAYDA